MAKNKTKQTPQEIYWERKRRDEEEKVASLPPGLLNQGNTCFMNSTLQGLIATRPLHDLMYFQPLSPSLQTAQQTPIVARRSPQLTNGHGHGGPDELEWTEGMPLGDIFSKIMRKAWDIQDAKRRESMNPKEILTTIGLKYDQYLDFRQQDAHEFLRHMLDAMRMEELDIIKKRQPPPPKRKRPRNPERSSETPQLVQHFPSSSSGVPVASPQLNGDRTLLPGSPNEEKLESFVDMLFGGQLASILVCEKCKKVSVTHEDFNDLSLSIKPEDYVKDRKRDRIKKIARKFRIMPPNSSTAHGSTGNGSGNGAPGRGRGMFKGIQRASSMPASPVRRSSDAIPHEEELPTTEDPRRRSYDHPGEGEGDEARDVIKDMPCTPPAPVPDAPVQEEHVQTNDDTVLVERSDIPEEDAQGSKVDEWTKVEAEANDSEEKEKGKEKQKDKDKDDAWGKLARRISVSMKLAGARDKDKDKDSRPSSRAGERGRKTAPKEAANVVARETRSPGPGATSVVRGTTAAEGASSDFGDTSDVPRSRALSPAPIPSSPQLLPALDPESKPASSRRSSANPFRHRHQPKSPLRPKMSEADDLYLRRILADIHPVTGNPLAIIQHALTGGGSVTGGSAASQALWTKLGHLPGVEECLRMFTAVEILDGDNMVGCHRCWKISNGTYTPNVGENGNIVPSDDSDSDCEDSDDVSEKSGQSTSRTSQSGTPSHPPGFSDAEESAAMSSPNPSSGRVSPASTSVVSTITTQASTRPDDRSSVSSAPTTVMELAPSPPTRKDSATSPIQLSTYGGLPIPQISTSEPDSVDLAIPGPPVLNENYNTWSSTRAVLGLSLSSDSLLQPKTRRRRRAKGDKKEDEEETGSSSEDDYDDTASDTSAPTSVGSDGSASPFVSPKSSVEKLSDTRLPSPLSSPKLDPQPKPRVQDKQIPRSKQVVPRRMYKRYLISTPPPILVVHLKRFQQSAKTPTMSFAGSFKKLDDFVSFPEHLDLAPFLAPKREDFTPEKLEREKGGKHRHQEPCMYRLYAVVVHIGNMLGGHYVAYAALPASSSPLSTTAPGTPSSETEKSAPATPSMPSPAAANDHHRTSRSSETHHLPRQWAYISDAVVKLTTLEEVLKAKAYICMYERI